MVWESNQNALFDSDKRFEFRRIRDIRVRDIEIRLYTSLGFTEVLLYRIFILQVIELEELKGLLKSVLADKITEKMVLKTFNAIDTDESGTIDFLEVLDVCFPLYFICRCSVVSMVPR